MAGSRLFACGVAALVSLGAGVALGSGPPRSAADAAARVVCGEAAPAPGFWRRLRGEGRPTERCGVVVSARRRLASGEPLTEFERQGLAQMATSAASHDAFGFEVRRLVALDFSVTERWAESVPIFRRLLAEGLVLEREEQLAWARGLAALGSFSEARAAYRALLTNRWTTEAFARLALELVSVDLLCEEGGEFSETWLEAALALGHPTLSLFGEALREGLHARVEPFDHAALGAERSLELLAVFEEPKGTSTRPPNAPVLSTAARSLLGAVLAEGVETELARARYADVFEAYPSLESLYGARAERLRR